MPNATAVVNIIQKIPKTKQKSAIQIMHEEKAIPSPIQPTSYSQPASTSFCHYASSS
jgi:hypothetical protein